MKFLKDIIDDFLSLFFPSLCLSCGESLVRGEEMLCSRCLIETSQTGYHLKPDNALEQLFWGRCVVERGAAFSVYNRGSHIRKLIHKMKYKGQKEIGYGLGKLYGSYLKGTSFMEGIDLFIPVPLHPSRLKQRGYNQSEYIARGLSSATGVPVVDNVLRRASKSATQTHRGRYERWENVEGLFVVVDQKGVEGKHIMLVDDVVTTGSTLEACVDALKRFPQVRVSVVTLAISHKLTV
jgi:ComF family protein